MPEISVIIPLYNVEKYIPKCLNSVLNQTFEDIEIICVNDCSGDNTLEVVKSFNDERIRIVDLKENKGVSNARNVGLENARGKYIYFIDADDWIDENYLEVMHKTIVKKDVDIVLNTNAIQHKKGADDVQFLPYYTMDFTENIFLEGYKGICNLLWNVWANLYKKSYLDGINARFPVGYPYGEDLYFQVITYVNAEKIYITRESSYHYLVRESGACKGLESDLTYLEHLLDILNLSFEYLNTNNYLENKIPRLYVREVFPPFDNSKKEKILLRIREYFSKIKPFVEISKEYYEPDEIIAVDEFVKDFEKAKITDYEKKIRIARFAKYAMKYLRSGLKEKGLIKR